MNDQSSFCKDCGSQVSQRAEVCPSCGVRQRSSSAYRNKYLAALLAFFLGFIGIHKFYLGRTGWGIVYLLFCWTGIPAIAAFVEFIIYLVVPVETFDRWYNGHH